MHNHTQRPRYKNAGEWEAAVSVSGHKDERINCKGTKGLILGSLAIIIDSKKNRGIKEKFWFLLLREYFFY